MRPTRLDKLNDKDGVRRPEGALVLLSVSVPWLVEAMARALDWGSGKPEISTFNWPIHTNNQLELGEDAARGGFGNRTTTFGRRLTIVL